MVPHETAPLLHQTWLPAEALCQNFGQNLIEDTFCLNILRCIFFVTCSAKYLSLVGQELLDELSVFYDVALLDCVCHTLGQVDSCLENLQVYKLLGLEGDIRRPHFIDKCSLNDHVIGRFFQLLMKKMMRVIAKRVQLLIKLGIPVISQVCHATTSLTEFISWFWKFKLIPSIFQLIHIVTTFLLILHVFVECWCSENSVSTWLQAGCIKLTQTDLPSSEWIACQSLYPNVTQVTHIINS